jgi:hypothetical protein
MHTQILKSSPIAGKTYTCIFNNAPLYDAVVENASGCWATVKVIAPHPGKHEHQYKQGQTFEIKVQYYEFVEKM